ncbi:trimethylamine methyltransferase family protein [Alisedimentitalea sp. MJ-SS2]|uniref:trimethylamine methyltransferase family protein n=1 Tax=Aliisedimentitalea sp. MJ-SS2 TaxID=3049795 RepID=UPI00290E2B8B|nr:trimethylamine methyltransferase family protein [Alisedimentitalea sp. MJ-SS2]MDU8929177.1 trimethylamine methyltransferase family protein [Alisedimentitalea sp. MJ-SS2]
MEEQKPKRRGRGVKREGPVVADAFNLGRATGRVRAHQLNDGQIAEFRARALELLEDYGVVVIHPKAHAALIKAGATVGSAADRLKLPRGLVEEALRETPKEARLCGKAAGREIALPRSDGQFIMRTGTGAHGYVDPRDTKYRNTDMKAVREMGAVAEGLNQVGFVAHPFVHGVPEVCADLHAFGEMVNRTTKHNWIQPYGKEAVEYLMRMAAVAAGGEAELKANPVASCITCSFTPLEFKYMDTECIIQAGKFGIPLHACSLPSAGGSAPLTASGMVLMAAAEIVAMVVLAHVLAPGVPVIATPLMFTLDMATGSAMQSCPESIQMAAMAIQLMKEGFGLLAHTYGSGSDTPDGDRQSMAERAMLGQQVALAGADILGGVGQLETATVFSPVQAVLDDEIGSVIRKALTPPEVSADAMNFDEVMGVRVGGHFLESAQTLDLCREQHVPTVFLRQGRDDYEKSDRRTAFDVARERALALIDAAPEEGYLSEDQNREIADLVQAGEKVVLEAASGSMDVI